MQAPFMCWDETPKDIHSRIVSLWEKMIPKCWRGPVQGRDVGPGQGSVIVCNSLCRKRPSSAPRYTSSAEHPKAPLCLRMCPVLLCPPSVSAHSNSHQLWHLQAVPFVSAVFLLMPFALGRTFAKVSDYAGLGLGKPKPTWC